MPDPAGQFWSPYLGMGNSWPNGVDPDGELFGEFIANIYSLFSGGTVVQAGNDWLVVKDGQVLANCGGSGISFGKSTALGVGSQVEFIDGMDGKVIFDPNSVGNSGYYVPSDYTLQLNGDPSFTASPCTSRWRRTASPTS